MTLKELIEEKRPVPVSMMNNRNLEGMGDKGYLIGGVLHLSPGVYHLIQVSDSKRLKSIMENLEVIEVPDFSDPRVRPKIGFHAYRRDHDESTSVEGEGRAKEG
jgi:hypothetical protein